MLRSFVKALAILLAVPVVCVALASTSRSTLDERWQASLRRPFLLRRQMPDERVIARYSLARLCGDPRTAAGVRPCRPYNLFSSMTTTAVATGGFGFVFLAAVVGAGAACRRRRDRLFRLFRPALYATLGGLVLLVILNGSLAVVGVFMLGEVLQRWPMSMVLVVAGAVIAVAISVIRHALLPARRQGLSLVARTLNAETQRGIVDWMGGISSAVGAPAPDQILVGLTPGIIATSAPVVCLDGRVTGRTLYASLALARILSVEEFRGLVAHEIAHAAGAQAAASDEIVPLHAALRRSLRFLSDRASGLAGATVWPALSVLSLFADALAPAVGSYLRERELEADRAASGLAGARTLASALAKAHAFTPAWDAVRGAMDRAVGDGTQYENASTLFEHVAAASTGPERLIGAGALSMLHPTDIHPTLGERLEALGVPPATILLAALDTQPPHPAATLVDGCEVIERDLSEVEHRIAAFGWARDDDDRQEAGWKTSRVHSSART
jgi:Zn-dependent protease with chaperone function